MRVTRVDVAKRAGVSTATVSYALNNPEKISPKTREKVMEAIKELDYRPDMVARSMATGKTRQIGIVLEDASNPFYGKIVRGFESAASEHNYFVNICTSFQNLDDYFDNFIARNLDGVFVAALPHKFQVEKLYELVDKGIKVVNSGNVEVDLRRVASIENDHIDAMHQAMEYLYSLGHREIAYLSALGKNDSYDLRCIGYRKMIEELKLSCGDSLLIDGSYPYVTGAKEGYGEAKKLLALGRKFTAVICSNDLVAFGAMKAFTEAGLKIPEDVSVIGFDGIELGEYYQPSLTTMALDQYQFGRKAFEILYSYMKHGTVGYYKNNLKLIKRDSTGICR